MHVTSRVPGRDRSGGKPGARSGRGGEGEGAIKAPRRVLRLLVAASPVPLRLLLLLLRTPPRELLREALYGTNSGSHAAGTPPLDAARGGRRAGSGASVRLL